MDVTVFLLRNRKDSIVPYFIIINVIIIEGIQVIKGIKRHRHSVYHYRVQNRKCKRVNIEMENEQRVIKSGDITVPIQP